MRVDCIQEVSSPRARVALLGVWGALSAYLRLVKVRLSALVVATTAVGYLVAGSVPTDWIRLGWTLLGTMAAVFGANALNQCAEAGRDARMRRTRCRPLPAGKMTYRTALTVAIATAAAGPLILAVRVNALTAELALISQLVYILVYTPLKARSTLNTLVGAACGTIPPMMGWAATTGELQLGAWVLGAVLFLWQIPHFLALAWVYRDDYARGGFRVLPVVDPTGHLTARIIVLYSLMLLPLGLMVTAVGMTGIYYAVGSLVLGVGLLALAVGLYLRRHGENARRLFVASVIYLPLLLGLMVADRTPGRCASMRYTRQQRAIGLAFCPRSEPEAKDADIPPSVSPASSDRLALLTASAPRVGDVQP